MENPFDPFDCPNVFEGFNYAQSVIKGEIIACKYIIGACRRFLKDLKEQIDNPHSKYVFDADYAERYLRLVQKFEHVIGNWETKEIIYLPWQKWVWSAALGFKHRGNLRVPKYRTLHIEVPRGASKSTMASQCALFFLGLEPNRNGEKLACFATKAEQSRIILDGSRAMAKKSAQYLKATGVEVLAHKIVDDTSNSEMVSMSSDSKSMDGLNLRVAFCDELHAMTRSLFDVIVSGMKKRSDSLVICLTTAGFDTTGVGFSQSQYAKKVATGELEAETFFSVIYTIDEGDDIFKESTWRKANPNYGASVDPIAFEATAIKAREVASDLANFKVKSLNVWLSEKSAYYDVAKWDECANPDLRIEDYHKKYCYSALDFASKIDLASMGFLFREKNKEDNKTHYFFFDRSYIPEKTVEEAKNVLYDNAIGEGYLLTTPGEAISYEILEEDYLKVHSNIRNHALHYDPWNTTQTAQNLEKKHVNAVEFRMNYANFSEAMKLLDVLIREKRIHHNGSPLLRFCIGNVVALTDPAGNVRPTKSHVELKIDPIVALLMCLAGWISEKEEESAYEERGIRYI